MRTSSIKTVVVTLSFTVILAAAPCAEARSSRTEAGAKERVQRLVNQLVNRLIGIRSEALPAEPTPISFTGTETTTATSPKKMR